MPPPTSPTHLAAPQQLQQLAVLLVQLLPCLNLLLEAGFELQVLCVERLQLRGCRGVQGTGAAGQAGGAVRLCMGL